MDFEDKIIINRKKMKNINIRIREGKVLVSAPMGVSDEYIYKLLKEKEGWIKEKLEIKRDERVVDILNRENIKEGEVVKFLGEDYLVRIKERSNGGVILKERELIINCYKKENAVELLKQFYIKNINELIPKKIDKMEEKTGLKPLKVTLKLMKTRWGSCNKNKRYLNINGELILKRERAIEYVILHELCHLVHGNHSKDFYDLVKKYMFDYRIEEIYLNGK